MRYITMIIKHLAVMFSLIYLQVWFQNRRAKFRKRDNTKKGPGRPAHNAHPQTCSGEPMDPEEIQRREQERLEKKRRKQEERLRKMEEKRNLLDANDTEGHKKLQEEYEEANKADSLLDASEHCDSRLQEDSDEEPADQRKGGCAFSIDRLLGNRQSDYRQPRVPSTKPGFPGFGVGMLPLFSVTQPIGFVVEQRQDEIKSDTDHLDASVSSEEGLDLSRHNSNVQYSPAVTSEHSEHSDSDADIDVTDDDETV